MKKFKYLFLIAAVVAAAGCIKTEYDLDKINTEVTLGGDSLMLPLGSTAKITVGDLIDRDEDLKKIFTEDASGSYSYLTEGNYSLTDKIPDFSDLVNIPGTSFDTTFKYALSGIKADSFKIESQQHGASFDIADISGIPTDAFEFTMEKDNEIDISQYAPSSMDVELPAMSGMTVNMLDDNSRNAIRNAAQLLPDDTQLLVEQVVPSVTLNKVSTGVSFSFDLPSGVKSVDEIVFAANSKIIIELEVVNPPFTSEGNVLPDLKLDLSQMLLFSDGSGIVNVKDVVLNASNNYSATVSGNLASMVVNASDFDATTHKLSLSREFSAEGSIVFDGIKAVAKDLKSLDNIQMNVKFSFQNAKFSKVKVGIGHSKSLSSQTYQMCDVSVKRPDLIRSIDTIRFDPSKGLNLTLSASNVPDGLTTTLETISLKFPATMKVAGADETGVLTFTGRSLPFSENIVVEYIRPTNAATTVDYRENVIVDATVKAAGSVWTSDLSGKIGLKLKAEASLAVGDFSAVTDNISRNIAMDPVGFKFLLPDDVADMGTIKVTPKGNPAFSIGFTLPESKFDFKTGEDGITFEFPSLAVLKNIPAGCIYNRDAGTVTIKGEIPSSLKFDIDYLLLKPVMDSDGKYYAQGQFSASGAVSIPSTKICKADIDNLSGKKADVSIKSDAIEASDISLDKFEIRAVGTTGAVLVKAGQMPSEIVSVGEALLEDCALSLAMEASGLPDFGAGKDISLSIKATLPSWITPNQISVSGTVKDGKFSSEPVKIQKFDFTGVDLKKDVKALIDYDVTLSVDNPVINLSSLAGDIKARVICSISDIKLSRVSACVDYKLESLNAALDLTQLTKNLPGGLDFVLDIDNPRLLLEVNTNLCLPAGASASLKPWSGGVPDETKAVEISLDLPVSTDPARNEACKYFIAGKDKNRPSDYTWCKADIVSMLKDMPDSVTVAVNVGTDPAREAVIDMKAAYKLDLGYKVEIPFAVGEDFMISFSDTLGISGYGKYFKYGNAALCGTISNSLPLQLSLEISFLDAEGNQIPGITPLKQDILSCKSDGTASENELKMLVAVSDKAGADRIEKLRLHFEADAGAGAGRSIAKENYVQAKVFLSVPGGITFDL